MSNDFVKLRLIGSLSVQRSTDKPRRSPIEELLNSFPVLPDESENEYKLRLMNISIPWTQNEKFREAYLMDESDLQSKYSLGKTSKLIVCVLLIKDDDITTNLLESYGTEYLKMFLKSLYEISYDNFSGVTEYYAIQIARALYRRNYDFIANEIKNEEIHRLMKFSLIQGSIIECVQRDDEIIFDEIVKDDPYFWLIGHIINISTQEKAIKYIRKILEHNIKKKDEQEYTYYYAFNNTDLRIDQHLPLIKAIQEISGWSLYDILDSLVSQDGRGVFLGAWLYIVFYLAGLPINDITRISNTGPKRWRDEWDEFLLEEDV